MVAPLILRVNVCAGFGMLKQKACRSRKYLDWVKTLDCCNCQAPADDPHHLIGVGKMGGMGITAPDTMVMPLCRGCRTLIHNTPSMWPMQWEWIARTLDKAISEGVL